MKNRALVIWVGVLAVIGIVLAVLTLWNQHRLEKKLDRNPFIEHPLDK